MQATAAAPQATSEELAAELLELWGHLMKGGQQQVFAVIGELDLTLTQMKTLGVLDGCTAEISVKELGELLGLSLPGASRTVDALLRRGWLERRENPDDRRMKRLRITDSGRDIVRRVNTARLEGLEVYAASLSDAQRRRLLGALRSLPHKEPSA